MLIHLIVIFGFYSLSEKKFLFSEKSDTSVNKTAEREAGLASFLQKNYFNFENNRFFLQFTIVYAIVFLFVKYYNERRESAIIKNKKNRAKKHE